MKRLMVEIEREVTRRFWNAVDRPEPIKWATNGGRARTPSPPVSSKEAQKRPNQPTIVLFYLGLRFLGAGALSTVHLLIDGSPRASRIYADRPRRPAACPKVRSRRPHLDTLKRVFYTICSDHKLSDRDFLLYPAARL